MNENLFIIILAITLNYVLESFNNNYSCPVYCEVNHKHRIEEDENDKRSQAMGNDHTNNTN